LQFGILGADGGEVFLHYRSQVLAFSLGSGEQREVTGEMDAQALQLSGGRLWYTEFSEDFAGDLVTRDLGDDDEPEVLYPGGCRQKRLGQDWFLVQDDGIYCTRTDDGFERLSLDGSSRRAVRQGLGRSPGNIAHVDGSTAYFASGVALGVGSEATERFSCEDVLFDAVVTTPTHLVWATGSTLFFNASGYLPPTLKAIYALPK
jgi:hypothetical protein